MTPAVLQCTSCGSDVPVEGDTSTCPECGETYPTEGLAGSSSPTPQQTGKSAEMDVLQFWRMLGARPYKLSTPGRPRGVSRGVPDFLVFGADCDRAPELLFHEVKAGSGRLSEHQEEFRAYAEAAAIPVVVGDASAAAEFLGLNPTEAI